MNDGSADWKLQLRYGRLTTEFSHFTVIADGVAGKLAEGFTCPPGPAWMTMKAWAENASEAGHMIGLIARHLEFSITGEVLVYDTEPDQPPQTEPHGYGIVFTPYSS
jgi:hypothetical protein